MKTFIILFVLLFVCDITAGMSCYGGRAGCVASCNMQNCGTGYCSEYGGTCVCSRCARGSNWRKRRAHMLGDADDKNQYVFLDDQ
ncbi:hypothetical protein QR680_003722 [Steinernema hermaphroditum]|uniref:Invertebrate defensins family profile domain-containing protein n=1 Tax=Steinernema hermaphroditum TaxID=289476 RepID=A0AA39HMQ0_9BILA|nr:hypothetical protein QR680_003722 [Steinernema hermaphroditum]